MSTPYTTPADTPSRHMPIASRLLDGCRARDAVATTSILCVRAFHATSSASTAALMTFG